MQVLLERTQTLLTCCAGQGRPWLKIVSIKDDGWKELSDLMQFEVNQSLQPPIITCRVVFDHGPASGTIADLVGLGHLQGSCCK